MTSSFLKSSILHIIIIILFTIPIFNKVSKREIVPSTPIPIIFENISKKTTPSKPVAKLSNEKPISKPKLTKPNTTPVVESKKEVVKIPENPKPIEKSDFSSVMDKINTSPEKANAKLFDSVLKDLTPEKNKVSETIYQETVPDSIMDKLKDNFTISEETALRIQIMNNWLVPVGAKDIEQMEVDIKLQVGTSGFIKSIDIIKNKYYQKNNSHYDTFVQSAKRAILKSSPLKLSDERMKIENEIVFHFSPKDMF
jgi:hypothetical protein